MGILGLHDRSSSEDLNTAADNASSRDNQASRCLLFVFSVGHPRCHTPLSAGIATKIVQLGNDIDYEFQSHPAERGDGITELNNNVRINTEFQFHPARMRGPRPSVALAREHSIKAFNSTPHEARTTSSYIDEIHCIAVTFQFHPARSEDFVETAAKSTMSKSAFNSTPHEARISLMACI